MKYRTRTFYSETQKALMWERWREGESLQTIAQLFDRQHGSVRGILLRSGGIRPPARRRAARALALAERSHPNVAVTALANKTARVAWAMLRHGANYEPERVAA